MERLLLFICALVLTGSTMLMLWRINERFLVTVPRQGGELVEGIIGTPRFINPVLALTDSDKDLTMLVYSGLMRASEDGLIPDLAESYTVSDDGLTYTFTLREGVIFHDGKPITAQDVAYTIAIIQDPQIKSPRRASWENVETDIVDARTIRFTLRAPYSSFLENTTVGILPSHIWSSLSAEQFSLSNLNIEPIGSGPYHIKHVAQDKNGLPQAYTLVPFDKFALGKPLLAHIITRFYPNQTDAIKALNSGEITSISGISPAHLADITQKNLRIEKVTLPRVFAVFWNQNHNKIFTHKEVREALSVAIPRRLLIENVLNGFGQGIIGPTPDDVMSDDETNIDTTARAQTILEDAGWKKNDAGIYTKKTSSGTETLTFTISTADVSELKASAEFIRDAWQLLGADVSIEVFDTTALNQNVIRPRTYDALLFGEVVGRDRDLYPFWHSSGRNDPGLNVALYTNSAVDKLLDEVRKTTDMSDWENNYEAVRQEIIADQPAAFLYTPELIYILPSTINDFSFARISIASERWATIYTWYTDTQRVWSIFAK